MNSTVQVYAHFGVIRVLCPLWSGTWLPACLNVQECVGVHHSRWTSCLFDVGGIHVYACITSEAHY